MRMTNAPIIESDKDLRSALVRMSELFDAPAGSDEAYEAEALAIMIESYERRTIPAVALDPVAAIAFAMEQRGYNYAALSKVIGSSARASDVMNRRRRLSLSMIRRLHSAFQIPLESLIDEVPIVASPKKQPGRRPLLAVSEAGSRMYGDSPRKK